MIMANNQEKIGKKYTLLNSERPTEIYVIEGIEEIDGIEHFVFGAHFSPNKKEIMKCKCDELEKGFVAFPEW